MHDLEYISADDLLYESNTQELDCHKKLTSEQEETVLVEIIKFFNDMGLPDDINSTDYDSLTDKICEPAFWEYN